MSLSNHAAGGSIACRSHNHKARSSTKLNLVSLMDIFTILVFFLMLNTGEVEVLQPDENIALPKSYAKLRPDNSPVIKISGDTVYFKEQAVVELSSVQASEELIEPLFARLETYRKAMEQSRQEGVSVTDQATQAPANSISIMGDASVPYALLKKVLYTCAQADFRDIALAVEYTEQNSVAQNGVASNGAGA